ncbi:MAG: class I SAM-dependent methyltransferase [Candidatus Zixiibacteriota bacterium]|nr:MAG: class I SAM-dependent methyltransferase [candidate division Zixibacteria bacterium]
MKDYIEKLRGSPELIRKRLASYIDYFEGRRNVLDLACGRGEFLGLLKDSNIPAVGVDSDPDAIGTCRRAGYTVEESDIIEFLKNNSGFDGIMASQIVEHLDGPSAEELTLRCFEALRPGGIIVLVTLNPENLTAITRTFWLDPTHVRPYPLDLLIELLKSVGFEIVAGGGAPATLPQGIRAMIKRRFMAPVLRLIGLGQLRQHLYSAHDIFVIAQKPGIGNEDRA